MERTNNLHHGRNKSGRTRTIVYAVLLVLIIGVVAAFALIFLTSKRPLKDHYQAVYTTNGQVYFGKLKNTNGAYLYLESAYTAQNIQESKDNASDAKTTLLKVSAQVYGPEDTMAIRSENVVFWQDLRKDSKVTQAIEQNK